MKRILPLLLLVFALGGVAFLLTNSGDSDSVEGIGTPSLTTQLTDDEAGALDPIEESLESLPETAERVEAGTDSLESAGLIGVETLTLEGFLVLPLGSPVDPSLRVVAISIEYDEEQAFIKELQELQETDPDLSEARALAFREKIDSEPYEGRPYTTVEVNPDGSFSFEVTDAADGVELRLKARYLYLEETGDEKIEEGRTYRLEPKLGAYLTLRVSPPLIADATLYSEAVERMEVELRGAESGGMMGMFRAAKEIEMESLGDGLFEARALPASLYWTASLDSPDYVDARTNATKLKPGEKRELQVALDMGARISGVAVTERGEPIEGAELSVRATNDTRFWMGGGQAQETESNEDGHFEMRGIPAGEVRLSGRLKGRKSPESLEVEVMDGEERGGYELVFTDGLSIHGFVLWPDDTPVNEARVGLETGADGGGERWRRNANQLWVTTDEEGAFALTGLVPGTYRVRANHESQEGEDSLGRWRGVMEGVSAGTSGVEVRLEEPGVVSGRVVKTDGTLLEEEEADRIAITLSTVSESDASIRSAHGSLYRRGDVEEDGTFRITGIYAAEYDVNIDSDKFVHAEPDQRHIHPSGELIVQVSRGASITGVLLDPSGAPVESCEVTASTGEEPSSGWGGGGSSDDVRTKEGGVFTFEGLKSGTYKLVAESDEWANNLPVEVQVDEGQEVANVTLQLLQGGTILGTVYGEDGEPVDGRSVMVAQGGFMGMGGEMGGEETTDASGRFIVEHVTPGSYTVMTQPTMDELGEVFGDGDRQPGFADFMSLIETVSVEIADGETVEVVLGAPPASPVIVTGRVIEADQPITTGSVLAVADGQGFMEGSETARIEGNGHYEMTLDEPGDYVFLIQGAGDGFGGLGVDFPVTIPDVERFDFDIEMPSAAIEGVVIGADGRTRAGENVMLFPAKSSTGMGSVSSFRNEDTQEDGGFLFRRLRPGTYVLQAGGRDWNDEPTGRVNQIVELGEGELAKVQLELAEPGTIEGVVLGQDGSPIEGATIFFRSASGMVQASRQPVMSGSNGNFRNNGLAPGAVTVIARTNEGSTPESGLIQVRAGDISNVELVLENGTLLHCVCEDANGDPLRASVSVLDEAGHEQAGLKTRDQWMQVFTGGGEERETQVGPLPPGKYTIVFTTDDGETARRIVRLTGRPERKVRVRIRD